MGVNYYHIDNMAFMKKCKNKEYDLAIVDPPYGIDINKSGRLVKDKGLEYEDWDKKPPDKSFFIELKRVSKNQIIWGGNYFDLGPARCYIIWDKKQPQDFSFAGAELAWTSFNRGIEIFRWFPQKENKNRIHPTQKPIAVYNWILNKFAKKGYRILDTHLGSGSLGISCYDMGFEMDGCEIGLRHYQNALQRLEKHKNRNHLF